MKHPVKKILSSMFVGCMLLSATAMSAGAFSSTSELIADASTPFSIDSSRIIDEDFAQENDMASRATRTVKFDLAPGEQLSIDSFSAQYPKGTKVILTGTWIPSSAKLAISLQGLDGGGFESDLTNANSRTYILHNDTVWNLKIKSEKHSVTGSLTIRTDEP